MTMTQKVGYKVAYILFITNLFNLPVIGRLYFLFSFIQVHISFPNVPNNMDYLAKLALPHNSFFFGTKKVFVKEIDVAISCTSLEC